MTDQEKIALKAIQDMFKGKGVPTPRLFALEGQSWIKFLLHIIEEMQSENQALHYSVEMMNVPHDPNKAQQVFLNLLNGKNPNAER